jgi:hypothetical protein
MDFKDEHNNFPKNLIKILMPSCSLMSLKIAVMILSASFFAFGLMLLSGNKLTGAFLICLAIGLWRMTLWAWLMSLTILLLLTLGIFNPLTALDVMLRGKIENTPILIGMLALVEGLFLTALVLFRRNRAQFRRHLI